MDLDLVHYPDLKQLCLDVRQGNCAVGEDEVALTERLTADLAALRAALPGVPEPPEQARRALLLGGWLMYEVSFALLNLIPPDWEGNDPDGTAAARHDLVRRTADAARGLSWPEFSPRALGAIRAHALGASKRNTGPGYVEAWGYHDEARQKFELFRGQIAGDAQLVRAYAEIHVQLRLAETGTSCREPERLIGQWPLADDPAVDRRRGEDALQRMYRRLREGVARGDDAVRLVLEVKKDFGLADLVDEYRLLTPANVRNPGIMSARAYLIMLPMTMTMAALGRQPAGTESWDEARQTILAKARTAYEVIEDSVTDDPFVDAHRRSVVQIRLNFAFVSPGFVLPSQLDFAECLRREHLDQAAIEEHSTWLAGDGTDRGDANLIGSAMLPAYLAALRELTGSEAYERYLAWRRRWPHLDRDAAKVAGRPAQFERAARYAELI